MLESIRKRLPRFSVSSLFLLTSALALGFAISQSPPPDEPVGWSSIYPADLRIPEGIIFAGSLLVIFALLRQAFWLRSSRSSAIPEFRFSIHWAISLRLALASFISFLAVLQLCLNRKILLQVDRDEYNHVWGDIWPDMMLALTLITALRMMLPRKRPMQSVGSRWVFNLIVMVGVYATLAYVLIDRLGVTALVHAAVESNEHHHAIQFQRPGVYPSHRAEGFRSFWQSAAAAGTSLFAMTLLLVAPRVKGRLLLFCISVAVVASIVRLAFYVEWFVSHEFPRISPDLAGVGFASHWTDAAAGLVLLVGIMIWIGSKSAIQFPNAVDRGVRLPKVSGFAVLGAIAIAVAAGWNWLWMFREALEVPGVLHGWSTFLRAIRSLGVVLFYPEMMIQLALFVSACSLIWYAFRAPEVSSYLVILKRQSLIGYSLAWLALLLVAIPTLAIFGFCYWLGPCVL